LIKRPALRRTKVDFPAVFAHGAGVADGQAKMA
jgi:hypothetical protein